jgi:hypothetical protein
MEPRIQYAKTSDGVSIAYWSLGEGISVIMTPAIPWSNLETEWRYPAARSWYQGDGAAMPPYPLRQPWFRPVRPRCGQHGSRSVKLISWQAFRNVRINAG